MNFEKYFDHVMNKNTEESEIKFAHSNYTPYLYVEQHSDETECSTSRSTSTGNRRKERQELIQNYLGLFRSSTEDSEVKETVDASIENKNDCTLADDTKEKEVLIFDSKADDIKDADDLKEKEEIICNSECDDIKEKEEIICNSECDDIKEKEEIIFDYKVDDTKEKEEKTFETKCDDIKESDDSKEKEEIIIDSKCDNPDYITESEFNKMVEDGRIIKEITRKKKKNMTPLCERVEYKEINGKMILVGPMFHTKEESSYEEEINYYMNEDWVPKAEEVKKEKQNDDLILIDESKNEIKKINEESNNNLLQPVNDDTKEEITEINDDVVNNSEVEGQSFIRRMFYGLFGCCL